MAHLSPQQRIQRRLTAFGLIALVVALAISAITFAPQASERTVLENQATVYYCDETNTPETCNPEADIFSYTSSSNLVTTHLTSVPPQVNDICITGLKLANRRQELQNHAKIRISVLASGTNTEIAQVTAASDTSGRIAFQIPNLDAAQPYDIKIKPAGYLAVRIPNVTGIYTGCHSIAAERTFIEGDFHGDDNEIKLVDISTAIAARTSTTPNEVLLEAYPDTDGKPSLQSLARIINAYINARRGDE